ncbi:hypothetical protein ACTID9_26380 [Brevibacillus fluminis]|uniref:hypothetical protein n=1 Tax=Brevibacillus fluminis TaxID=511487 RepID=UPI003F88D708
MNTIQNEENMTSQTPTEPVNDQKKIPAWKKVFKVVKTIFYAIVAFVFLLKVLSWIGIDLATPIDNLISQFSAEQKYVDIVREGNFKARPNQKIGDSFDKFFGSPKWTAFNSDTGQKIVEFTGDFTYQQQQVKARMQFIVNPESGSFEIHTIGFNDIPQNKLMQVALLAKVFEGKEIEATENAVTDSQVTPDQPNTVTTSETQNTAVNTPDQQATDLSPSESSPSETIVEGLAVAFPEGMVVVLVNDQEKEYPVASNVEVTESGHPSEWTKLQANMLLNLTIVDGVVVAIDIL